MMNAEFFTAIEDIEKEKGIPKDYMLDKIVQALLAAVRKEDPALGEGAVVGVDEAKKTIEVFVDYNVVEPDAVENPVLDLTLDQAKLIDKDAVVGGKVREKVETKQFGRIAAPAAKQVIIQGIRDAERGMVFEEFTSKEHEILTGVVSRIDPKTGNVYMKIASNADYTEAVLTPSERVRSEIIRDGDRMKVYVVEVRRSTRGAHVWNSSHLA